jgi:hypothetical protein
VLSFKPLADLTDERADTPDAAVLIDRRYFWFGSRLGWSGFDRLSFNRAEEVGLLG